MSIYTLSTQSELTQHIKHHTRVGTAVFSGTTSLAITFDPIFDNDTVYITLAPNDNIEVDAKSITKSGFTIETSVSFTGNVYWVAWV